VRLPNGHTQFPAGSVPAVSLSISCIIPTPPGTIVGGGADATKKGDYR